MKKTINNYYPILIILILIFLTHVETILNNSGLMIFYGDSYEQMLQFYLGGWERMRELNFSQWDWSLGYGANYFSHVYYFASSPFFFLTLFFEKAVIPYLFLYINALKIVLLYSFSYKWMSQLHQEKLINVICSIILSFSGWVIFFYNYNLFLDAFLLYPLILYSIEIFFKKKSGLLVTFSIAILAITNFYMLYMFAPFFVFYTIFRYFVIFRDFDIRHFSELAIKMIGYVCLGIGLSAVVLLPSINIILQTPRIQSVKNNSIFETISLTNIYRYLSTIFTPVVERFNPTYFISTEYDPGIGWGGGVSLYTFSLFPLALSFIFRLKDKFHKRLIISFYLILFLLSAFTITYRLLQGTYDVRWFYMFTLLNIYTLSYCMNEILSVQFSRKDYWVSALIPILSILSMLLISIFKKFYFSAEKLTSLFLIITLFIFFILVYSYFLYHKNRRILLFLVVLEALICFILPIKIDSPIDPDTFANYSANLLDSKVIDYIKRTDDSFYRIVYFDGKYGSQNNPIVHQYRGTSFYESIYNYEQNDFLDRFRSNWNMPVTFGRTNTTLLTSVKYFVFADGMDIIPFGFTFLKSIDGFKIYISDYPIDLGYALENTLNEEIFKALSILNQDRLLLNYIVTEESKNTTFQFLNQDTYFKYAENVYDDFYYFDNTFDHDILLYIENKDLPNIEVNKLKDSEFYSKFKYWQYFYLSSYIKHEDQINALEIFVNNEYNSKSGFDIYIDSDLSYYDNWYSDIKQNMFKDVIINKDHISSKIKITDKTKWVATTVPFDKGWSVRVNGEIIEYSKVNLGFIGFELEQGEYEVEMKYNAPFYNIGVFVSAISFVVLILLNIKFKLIRKV